MSNERRQTQIALSSCKCILSDDHITHAPTERLVGEVLSLTDTQLGLITHCLDKKRGNFLVLSVRGTIEGTS